MRFDCRVTGFMRESFPSLLKLLGSLAGTAREARPWAFNARCHLAPLRLKRSLVLLVRHLVAKYVIWSLHTSSFSRGVVIARRQTSHDRAMSSGRQACQPLTEGL